MPVGLLSLTDDSLLAITELISPEDARRLMAVCRDLLPMAKRRSCSEVILANRTTTPDHTIKAFMYMLEDVQDRLRWLRFLAVGETALGHYDLPLLAHRPEHLPMPNLAARVDRDGLRLFADLLSATSCLRNLSIETPLESLLPLDARLRSALTGLSHLTHFALKDVGPLSLETIMQMRTRLQTLSVCDEDFSLHTLPLLNFRNTSLSTVRTLRLSASSSRLFPSGLVDSIFLQRHVEAPSQWTSVHHLSLTYINIPSLASLARVFPNLSSLQLFHCRLGGDTKAADSIAMWTSLRVFDAAGSRFLNTCWPSTCHVHCLHLDLQEPLYRHEGTPLNVADVENASPVIFSLSNLVFLGNWTPLLKWCGVPVASLPRLRCFQLTMDYTTQSCQGLVGFLDSIADTLAAAARLVMIQVCLKDIHMQTWDIGRVQPSLDRLANSIPPLRYLSLGIGRGSSRRLDDDATFVGKVWWWRCKEAGNGVRVLKALETHAGQRLFEQQCAPEWNFDSDDYALLSTGQSGRDEQDVLPAHHYFHASFIDDPAIALTII